MKEPLLLPLAAKAKLFLRGRFHSSTGLIVVTVDLYHRIMMGKMNVSHHAIKIVGHAAE